MNILNIEEIVLCIYNNLDLRDKVKLSSLSTTHFKLISTLHKLCKTVLNCSISGRKNHEIGYDHNYLYIHDRYKGEIMCIDDKFGIYLSSNNLYNKMSIIYNGYLNNGLVVDSCQHTKHIKLLPNFEEYDFPKPSDICYYMNDMIFCIERQINHYVLEYYYLFGVRHINTIELGNNYHFVDSLCDNMLTMKYYHKSHWVIKIINIDTSMVVENFEIKRKYELFMCSKKIWLCNDKEICCDITLPLQYKMVFKIPKDYYMLDDGVKQLGLACSVFVLVHYYYYVGDTSADYIEEVIPEDIKYRPACIIVILNKDNIIIHEEKIYLDYALSYYVVKNTVFIDNQSSDNPKILVYNFENVIEE